MGQGFDLFFAMSIYNIIFFEKFRTTYIEDLVSIRILNFLLIQTLSFLINFVLFKTL